MEKIWVLSIVILIFLVFAYLIWRLTNGDLKKEYGTKIWKHWPSRLYYWQGVVLYDVALTFMTLFILKWANVLTF